MLYPPSDALLHELRALRDLRWSAGHDDVIERDHDAFLIHLDVSAAYYLTGDGRVLVAEPWREATSAIAVDDDEARDAIAGGARFTPALRWLL